MHSGRKIRKFYSMASQPRARTILAALAGSRTRVTSMGGLYDAVTLLVLMPLCRSSVQINLLASVAVGHSGGRSPTWAATDHGKAHCRRGQRGHIASRAPCKRWGARSGVSQWLARWAPRRRHWPRPSKCQSLVYRGLLLRLSKDADQDRSSGDGANAKSQGTQGTDRGRTSTNRWCGLASHRLRGRTRTKLLLIAASFGSCCPGPPSTRRNDRCRNNVNRGLKDTSKFSLSLVAVA